MYREGEKCTSGCSCDRMRWISPKYMMVIVVIALLISPINFSEYAKKWEHNGWNVLTLHCLNSFPYHLLRMSKCSPCLFLIAHLSTPPHMLSPLKFSWAQKMSLSFAFLSNPRIPKWFLFPNGCLWEYDNCKMSDALFILWFNRFVVCRHDKIIT